MSCTGQQIFSSKSGSVIVSDREKIKIKKTVVLRLSNVHLQKGNATQNAEFLRGNALTGLR